MASIGVPGSFTLHSLRESCATRLYRKGFDEQQIKEVTGHTSNSVRDYKRTSDAMKRTASLAIQGVNENCTVVKRKLEEKAKETSGIAKPKALELECEGLKIKYTF